MLQLARNHMDIMTITGPKWLVSMNSFNHFRGCVWSRSQLTGIEAHADECLSASSRPSNKATIFLGLIEYELNSLLSLAQVIRDRNKFCYTIASQRSRDRSLLRHRSTVFFTSSTLTLLIIIHLPITLLARS